MNKIIVDFLKDLEYKEDLFKSRTKTLAPLVKGN